MQSPLSESELLTPDAALALAAAPGGPELPRDVIRRIVRDIPPALAYYLAEALERRVTMPEQSRRGDREEVRSTMKEAIGFIGSGLLGLPVAANLLDRGYALRVYNRTAAKTEPLVARGAALANSPADAATKGGIVVSLLWDDASVEEVTLSAGFLDALGPGGVHIAMSTILPETARKLAALHEAKGVTYLDAPVFGRPEAAIARKLSIALAGAKAAKDRVRPILEDLGGSGIFDFGEEVGAGVTVKLAGNFLILSATRSLGEALAMVDKSGVDAGAVLAMLTSTLFPSPIYESYGQRIVDKTPFPKSNIPQKDMGLFVDAAEAVGAAAPMSTKLYELVKAQ